MAYSFEVRELPEQKTLTTKGTCAHDQIGPTLERLLAKAGAVMKESGLRMEGPPFCLYTEWRETDCDLEAGCPISGEAPTDGEVTGSHLPTCTAVVTIHTGPYDLLPQTHAACAEWIQEKGKEFAGPCWEVYLTDPGKEPDASKWITQVYYPIA
jgi:effector-binding domain-containing protein